MPQVSCVLWNDWRWLSAEWRTIYRNHLRALLISSARANDAPGKKTGFSMLKTSKKYFYDPDIFLSFDILLIFAVVLFCVFLRLVILFLLLIKLTRSRKIENLCKTRQHILQEPLDKRKCWSLSSQLISWKTFSFGSFW